MSKKYLTVGLLATAGVYFLLFHTAPFPFSHDAIGLPPYHVAHAAFGALLFISCGYILKKKE